MGAHTSNIDTIIIYVKTERWRSLTKDSETPATDITSIFVSVKLDE